LTLLRFNPVLFRLTAATACLCFVGYAWAQADQPTLDDLLDLSPRGSAVTDRSGDEALTADQDKDLADSVQRALSASEAADAFEQAVQEMDEVSRRLGRALDPGVDTQRMQESILRKLDQVIDSAKQQQSSSGGGGSGRPRGQDTGGDELAQQQQPASGGAEAKPGGQQASTGGAGSGSPQDPEAQDSAIEQLRKEWGTLPPRLRDELTQGLRERFSPLYRDMTEAYYKALAEQE